MKQEAEFQKIMEGVEDMGKDSYYPLVTNDESKKVDYVIKINQDKLDKVFDPKNKNNFNLQSMIIENDHFAAKKK